MLIVCFWDKASREGRANLDSTESTAILRASRCTPLVESNTTKSLPMQKKSLPMYKKCLPMYLVKIFILDDFLYIFRPAPLGGVCRGRHSWIVYNVVIVAFCHHGPCSMWCLHGWLVREGNASQYTSSCYICYPICVRHDIRQYDTSQEQTLLLLYQYSTSSAKRHTR